MDKTTSAIDIYFQANAGLPANWEVRHSNSKNLPYYFNDQTKESRWEPPAGTDTEKLKAYMAQNHSSATIRPPSTALLAAKDSNKIRAAHLLVKHKESRRPSSWREAQITRTKEEAMSIILGHEARIRSCETSLGDLAVTESDCSSARKRGDLWVRTKSNIMPSTNPTIRRGFFGEGDMQKGFETAAFALKPGEVSHVVETDSGVHLIERYALGHSKSKPAIRSNAFDRLE